MEKMLLSKENIIYLHTYNNLTFSRHTYMKKHSAYLLFDGLVSLGITIILVYNDLELNMAIEHFNLCYLPSWIEEHIF